MRQRVPWPLLTSVCKVISCNGRQESFSMLIVEPSQPHLRLADIPSRFLISLPTLHCTALQCHDQDNYLIIIVILVLKVYYEAPNNK